jgi:cytoskeletal protein RodZ
MEESLGKTLRNAREASGITVDDAVYRARMPRAVVEALEADDFGFFASPLYARSFLKQYGEYIGVDVDPWIDDIVPTPLIDSDAAEAYIDIADPDPVPAKMENTKEKSTGGGAMAAVWMVLITGGLVWGGVEYFRRLDGKLSTPAPQQAAAPAPVQEDDAVPETPEEKPIANAEPEAPRRAIIVNLPE